MTLFTGPPCEHPYLCVDFIPFLTFDPRLELPYNRMRKYLSFLLCFGTIGLLTVSGWGQETLTDSTRLIDMPEVTVTQYRFNENSVQELSGLHQGLILSGKKNVLIQVSESATNIAEKNARQIFARVPGVFVYDMDGSGNQVNISNRGLDPHRSWEYNVRLNGVLLNSDMYGYPASHYSPPMEAVQNIQMVQGTGSLQYGAQFGGMVNYLLKDADTTRPLAYEGIVSAGSFGMWSTYQALHGSKGKWRYYAYYYRRTSDGYRDEAASDAEGQYLRLEYQANKKMQFQFEIGRSQYLYKIPGPLTDAQFLANPRMATRSRNYYSPDILVPSLTWNYKPGSRQHIQLQLSGLFGDRSSVQFLNFANVPDTINRATGLYAPRQVDIDNFNSKTAELRYTLQYRLFHTNATMATGVRYIHNDMRRRQLGQGTTGTDEDYSVTAAGFQRDVYFRTRNVALFMEQSIALTPKWTVGAGARLESGQTRMDGFLAYKKPEEFPAPIKHQFLLLGANTQYQIKPGIKVYAGISQAYRPVILSEYLPATVFEFTDAQLRNGSGTVTEAGFTGKWKALQWQVSAFDIHYNNRVGTQVLQVGNETQIWRTNIGNAVTQGIEAYADVKIFQTDEWKASVFTSTAWMKGRYVNGSIRNGQDNTNLSGNALETVPEWTSRNGLQLHYRTATLLVQHSYVDDSFSDPLNTVTPVANGARGIVPAYTVWDINFSWRFMGRFTLRTSLNNATNSQYFTKRPNGYPGAGVWASDGRSVVVSFGVKL